MSTDLPFTAQYDGMMYFEVVSGKPLRKEDGGFRKKLRQQ